MTQEITLPDDLREQIKNTVIGFVSVVDRQIGEWYGARDPAGFRSAELAIAAI